MLEPEEKDSLIRDGYVLLRCLSGIHEKILPEKGKAPLGTPLKCLLVCSWTVLPTKLWSDVFGHRIWKQQESDGEHVVVSLAGASLVLLLGIIAV